ncbi:MAG: TonB family protein [Gemmatirosa sp.]|nr:TonB family protein [Gemmatirosa sp.]
MARSIAPARSLVALAALLLLAAPSHAQPPATTPPAPVCDSSVFTAPVATTIDTLRLRMKSSAVLPVLPQPWTDLALDEIGARMEIPRPLALAAFDEAQPPLPPALPMEVEPSIYTEVRLTLRRDGHLAGLELVARSLVDAMDAALLHAVRAADSASALGPLPASVPDSAVVFLLLTRGTLPAPLGAFATLPSRDIARLSLPRYRGAVPIRPAPGTAGPAYPRAEREARTPGTVLAQFVVDADGAVAAGTTTLVSYTSTPFATSVLEFLPTARFLPARIGGCPVRQLVQQPFEFRQFLGAPAKP